MHEICIVGAGPVGLTLANCLAKSQYIKSIALLAPEQGKISQANDLRTYAITKNNLALLRNLNILQKIPRKGIINKIHAISKESQAGIYWNNAQAQIIQNSSLMAALLESAQNNQKISMLNKQFPNIQMSSIEQNSKHQLLLPVEEGLICKLLVGCDGYNSKVRKYIQTKSYGWDYNQRSIVFNAKIEEHALSYEKTAYQIYYQGNILALLPLWDNLVNVIWSVDNLDFQYLNSLPKQDLLILVNNILTKSQTYSENQETFPRIQKIISERISFPLKCQQIQKYTTERIAIIGDAAHRYHPMVGMGMNLGMRDAILLANNIIRNKKNGNDIGNALALSKFEVQCQKLHSVQSIGIEAVKKIFESDEAIFNKVRKIGIRTLQNNKLILETLRQIAEENPLSDVDTYQWQQE